MKLDGAVVTMNYSVSYDRMLKAETELSPDSRLAEHPDEYLELAGQVVKDKELLPGKALDCSYLAQGFRKSDPFIAIGVTDENGERVNVTFSRYDKTVTGVVLAAGNEIEDAAMNKLE